MLDVSNRLELFVSHFLIESLSGVSLKMHTPQKANRVIMFDQPWEGPFSGASTILNDAGRYLLYYRGMQTSEGGTPDTTCLATSSDGIHFEKPTLGLHAFDGSLDNNAIFVGGPEPHAFSPFIDTRDGVPEDERFKALAHGPKLDTNPKVPPLYAWKSPDGIHWSLMQKGPILTKGAFDSQNVAFWSEAEGCYVSYYRTFHDVPVTQMGGGPRTVSRAVSDDFIHWSDPIEMNYSDTPREEIYYSQTHPYFRAPHIYIALANRIIHNLNALSKEEGKALDIRMHHAIAYWKDVSEGIFMTTRAGSDAYDRTFMEAFMRPGRQRANWSSRCSTATLNIIPTADDEMSLYYNLCYASPKAHMQRYTLRTDGFSSIHACYRGGQTFTKLLAFKGKQLMLNFATSVVGSIRVELQDDGGHVIPGFGLEDCRPLLGDFIQQAVVWKNSPDLSPLAGKPVRIRYVMNDADLFSQQFM